MRNVKRRLADGSIKVYTYNSRSTSAAVTVGNVRAEYLASADFLRLKASTQIVYRRALDQLQPYDRVPIVDVRRRHILMVRDAFADRPGMGNQVLSAWQTILNFALDREYITASPYHKIRRLPKGQHARWSEDQIAFALATFPEWARRAVLLAIYTGQREADLCAMTWSDYDGEAIRVVQRKTGERVWVPCAAALRSELAAWRPEARAVTILAQKRNGQPWKVPTFAALIGREIRSHSQLSGLVFHGLRVSAATRLAEAGCTAHEIAAITGHRSLDMVAHYTREVDQKRNAKAAIVKLEAAKPLK